jgi:hypothetical protein
MASKRVTANTTAQTVAAEIKNSRYKVTSMTIDNKAGSGDRQITIQDIFTPDVTNGDSSPTEQTVNRYTFTALQGDVITLNEQDLKGVRCIGALKVVSDVTDASCYITVGFETD